MRTLDRTLCWPIVFLLLIGVGVLAVPAHAQTFRVEVLRQGLDPAPLADESYISFGDLGAPDEAGGVLFQATTRNDITLKFASSILARFDPAADVLVARTGDPAPGVIGETISFFGPFFGDGNRFGDVPVSLVLGPSFDLPAYAVMGNQIELFAAVGSAAPAPATGSLVQALAGCTDDLRRLTYPALYGSGAAFGGIGNYVELVAFERAADGEIFFTATHDIDPKDGALYVARGAPSLGPPALAALALGLAVAGAARLRQLRRRG